MSVADRVEYAEVPGADDLFTPDFLDYITAAYDKFAPSIADIRAKREAMIGRAVNDRALPDFPPESEINSGDWQVPPLPAELLRPGIEISGPVSITNMAINALNPGADGERATGYLDDDEDSAGHRLADTVMAAITAVTPPWERSDSTIPPATAPTSSSPASFPSSCTANVRLTSTSRTSPLTATLSPPRFSDWVSPWLTAARRRSKKGRASTSTFQK